MRLCWHSPPGLDHRHRIGRCRRLEAHTEEDDLATWIRFGDLDGVSQGVCGAVDLRLHPGAIRAYEEAGHSVADCLRP